ncbi:MAG: sel1 repeat family protein [Bacteroidales bacterium]|nr:sel1 repeat family protein [Bacteroidales bacterium]
MKSTDKELFDLLTRNNGHEEAGEEEVLEVDVQEEEFVDEAFLARSEKDAAAQKLWRDAKAGDAGSQQELGDELFRQKRYTEAFGWYRKAAAQKYELAYYDLGWSYHYGLGTDVDFKKAIKWYKKYDAVFGDPNVYYQIGRCYELGLGDKRNAENWYQKAADKGNAPSELALKQMKKVEADEREPDIWFERGKNAFWDISSHRDVIDGKVYNFVYLGAHHDPVRHLEALRWWHKAAVSGHAESQFYLALHAYQRCYGQKALALRWFIESAKNGYAKAQAVLANKYEYGEGVEINERKARMWRKKAANNTGDDKVRKATVSSGKLLKRILLLAVTVLAIVLIRRMDQMSYKPVSEADAVALAQKVTVVIPDQEIKLLGSDKTRKLQTGTRVKVLGVYKQKLNNGNSPRVYWTNQEYLVELPDGKRGHGPLMETALGQKTILPTGDTAVITSVWKLAKVPKVWANGRDSRYQFAYTLKGHKGQYALEDLKIYFPQRVTYLAEGLTAEKYFEGYDDANFAGKALRKVWKFFTYDIRPVTKKPGYFLFPKYQIWNEFLLQYWFRVLMIVVAYILELLIIFRWLPRLIRGR